MGFFERDWKAVAGTQESALDQKVSLNIYWNGRRLLIFYLQFVSSQGATIYFGVGCRCFRFVSHFG